MRVSWVAAAFLAASCSKGAPAPQAPAPTARGTAAAESADAGPPVPTLHGPPRVVAGRYYVAEGAPDPLACRADKDCIGDTFTDDTGCCVRTPDTVPQTWAWHVWISERRLSRDCHGVSCPPLPVGTLPKSCRIDVRCTAGRCADSCSDQPENKQDGSQEDAPQKK